MRTRSQGVRWPEVGLVTRRSFLRVGSLGGAGLALPQFLHARAAGSLSPRAMTSFGKAKSCILLFMDGGQAQQDTFDLKPDAPAEIRGEFKPIATAVPGMRICEHFPATAKLADHFAIVRSIHVGSEIHEVGTYAMLTGTQFKGKVIDANPSATPEDTPCIGSVVSYMRGNRTSLPAYIWHPFIWQGFSVISQGYAGHLGSSYEPFRILQDPNAPQFRVEALTLPQDVSLDRLDDRRGLRTAVNSQSGLNARPLSKMENHYHRAVDILRSARAR